MPKSRRTRAKANGIALVTGATSGIGRKVVEELLKSGYETRVILRRHPNEHSEWKELPRGAKVYVADIRHLNDHSKRVLSDACTGVSSLFHLAAATHNYGKRYSNEKLNTDLMLDTNVMGTENVMRAYSDANPGTKLRFVYASSVAVYGYKRSDEVLNEESEPMPSTAYGESKYMAEQVIKAFAAANKRIEYTIFRIGVMYGENYENDFMHIFKLIKEGKLRYIGNGRNHLTLINVADAATAMVKSISKTKQANKIYNLTDGVPYTQMELFVKAAKMLKLKEPSKSVHPILAKIAARSRGIGSEQFAFLTSDRIVSIDRAKRELGFKPASIDIAAKPLVAKFLKLYKAER